MDAAQPPAPPEDPLLHLPRSVYYQVVHDLQRSLPAPADDTEEALAHRINAAVAEVASMLPANAEEAAIAARSVGAHAQAMDCLRLARQQPDHAVHVLRCSAQSAAMQRTANSARSLLLRVQAARRKREADATASDAAAWTEHCVTGLMLGALNALPPPPPAGPAVEPEAAADDRFSRLTEAEQYAVHYPRRAAAIRAEHGVPANCRFGPPEPELVEAILASTSPMLRALDHPAARAAA